MEYLSLEVASNPTLIIFTILLQLFYGITNACWMFLTTINVSTNDFGNSHLNTSISFSLMTNDNKLLPFHLLAILLFDEFHKDKLFFDILVKFLDVMCFNWRDKIIESSSNGAPNVTCYF